MLGRSAASKISYVRLVGGPENTSSIGENPNINNLVWPPRPYPSHPANFFVQKLFIIIYGTFSALEAPYRAILQYYRCDTPYRAILFKGI